MSDPTRPARDELPVLACFAERNGGQLVGARREAVAALDEIDTLRRQNATLAESLRFPKDWTQSRAAAELDALRQATGGLPADLVAKALRGVQTYTLGPWTTNGIFDRDEYAAFSTATFWAAADYGTETPNAD